MSCSEALAELIKDKAYFGSEGGITVSGGEATLQADFVQCLFSRLKANGIHTALDTCGICTPDQLRTACEHADLILFDLKEAAPFLHATYTRGPLEAVQQNFSEVVDLVRHSRLHSQAWRHEGPKRLWVRTPVIPGITDRIDNITAIAGFILDKGEGLVDRWELCAFNNLCRDKYLRLDNPWPLESLPLTGRDKMDELAHAAVEAGLPQDVVCWTGMTRDPNE